MKPKVYIESSVVSYYTGRASRDIVIAGRQQSTQDFWPLLSQELVPHVSALVVRESGKGDPEMARKRLGAIASFAVLATTPDAERLAQEILDGRGIPREYPEDGPSRRHCRHLRYGVHRDLELFAYQQSIHEDDDTGDG